MRRFFAKNLLFVISVNLLVKPVWIFMIDRTVQNTVGHSSYGPYQALFNLGIIFNILLDFGISNYNSKTIAQDPEKIKQLFPAMLSARVILSLLYVTIVSCIGLVIGYRRWEIGLLLGILIIQALNSVMLFVRSNVAGLHKFRADGLLSVTDRFLMIVVCGVLLFYPPLAKQFRIEWFVGAQIACYGAAIIIGMMVLKKISGVRLHFSIDRHQIFAIIKDSFPYALLIFLMSIYTRVDVVLIERLCGDAGREQAGIYAHGYRLLDVGNMFGLMFASMLLPIFGRMLAQKTSVQPIVQLCVNLLLPTSFLVMITGIFFSSELMHLLYKDVSATDAKVFTWLMIAFPAFSLSNIYSTLLTANGNLKLLNKIAFIGVVINLGLNFILIPKYLSVGAAFTAFITQSVLAIAFIIFAQKQAQLTKDLNRAGSFLIYLLILFLAGYGVKYLHIHWLIQLVALFGFGIVLMITLRFISLRSIKQLISK